MSSAVTSRRRPPPGGGPAVGRDPAPGPSDPDVPPAGEPGPAGGSRIAPRRAATPERARDALTAGYLFQAVRARWPHARPLDYLHRWWDGASHTPSLGVLVNGRKLRVVATSDGSAVLLPYGDNAARRTLRRRRAVVLGDRLAPPRRWVDRVLRRGGSFLGRPGWWRPAVTLTTAPVSPRRTTEADEARRRGQLALFDAERRDVPAAADVPAADVPATAGPRRPHGRSARIAESIDVDVDVVSCRHHDCGGLRLIGNRLDPVTGLEPPCPLCGRR